MASLRSKIPKMANASDGNGHGVTNTTCLCVSVKIADFAFALADLTDCFESFAHPVCCSGGALGVIVTFEQK